MLDWNDAVILTTCMVAAQVFMVGLRELTRCCDHYFLFCLRYSVTRGVSLTYIRRGLGIGDESILKSMKGNQMDNILAKLKSLEEKTENKTGFDWSKMISEGLSWWLQNQKEQDAQISQKYQEAQREAVARRSVTTTTKPAIREPVNFSFSSKIGRETDSSSKKKSSKKREEAETSSCDSPVSCRTEVEPHDCQ